ncbi:MAG: dTDP-glucose 4,6-dehydratase [Candidatus Methylomirabilis sp.]|nr:dTDP-glucose 4,6-dehydratase [Deltaproteobacteria bacterium]
MGGFSKILVTGGAGFIGSDFVRMLAEREPSVRVVVLDKLTYAVNLANLASARERPHVSFVRGDIADAKLVGELMDSGVEAVVNFAAETHVDRSIEAAFPFVHTNVLGTQTLLDAARKAGVKRYLQISTDEVYGSLGETGKFTETTPLDPRSPYSASKAGGDMLVLAYAHTHGFPAGVIRRSNNYGPHQFPEKLIPLFITNALEDKPLPIYGTGKNVRDWIFVRDFAEAAWTVLEKGAPGEVYNAGGESERTNLEVTDAILSLLGKPKTLLRYVTDRKGHDWRYAMDISRMRAELGWAPKVGFEEGLRRTVEWYVGNRSWWEEIKSGAYAGYYERIYGRGRGDA